ncbi:hypothetical protein M0R45_016042 [Rubus argutus]|uniref:Uncharacterized protein n=1 Tax=Rubus argutus TaxID=59490 RepID=A0AAW1XTW5_RUBAR
MVIRMVGQCDGGDTGWALRVHDGEAMEQRRQRIGDGAWPGGLDGIGCLDMVVRCLQIWLIDGWARVCFGCTGWTERGVVLVNAVIDFGFGEGMVAVRQCGEELAMVKVVATGWLKMCL